MAIRPERSLPWLRSDKIAYESLAAVLFSIALSLLGGVFGGLKWVKQRREIAP
jgi:hypothetical protein